MSEHWKAKEISRWLVEGPSAEAEEHLRGCFACQAKLAEAREPLDVFRTALVGWSESQPSRGLARPIEQSERRNLRIWMPIFGLAMAVALLVGILLGPSVFRKPMADQAKTSGVSDMVLMEQVDSEVSETVPDAMSPLTDLVAWDSGESSVESAGGGKQDTQGKSGAALKTNAKITD